MAELWDAYDANLQKLDGITLVRGEPVPDGMYHLVCEIAVRHADGKYLLMLRDARKHRGGMWELTAGGSALQSETPLQCARRELLEETGIIAENLSEIGRIVHEAHRSIYVEYLCVTSCAPDAVRLQEGETAGFRWVEREALMQIPEDTLAAGRTLKLLRESGR